MSKPFLGLIPLYLIGIKRTKPPKARWARVGDLPHAAKRIGEQGLTGRVT